MGAESRAAWSCYLETSVVLSDSLIIAAATSGSLTHVEMSVCIFIPMEPTSAPFA